MPDAREAALAAMAESLEAAFYPDTEPLGLLDATVREAVEGALDALASSPEVRAALVAVASSALRGKCFENYDRMYGLAPHVVDAVLAALAGTSGTEAG